MESIGTINAQGDTVLRKVPEQIRIPHNGGYLTLDRYTGPVVNTEHGTVQCGDYITFGLHLTTQWLAQNPTQWEKVR
jgi:hypothetical protein